MERLTTDNPKNNLQTALNLFYAKNGEAWVRGGGIAYEYQDAPLFQYIRSVIKHQALSQHLWEDLDDGALAGVLTEWLFDGHETTEGVVATLYTAAWAFAELRERLKAYEDTGLAPDQIAAHRWFSVSERLPIKEYEKHRKIYGVDPEFIVVINGAALPTVLQLHRDTEGKYYWHDGESIYPVSHWSTLPPTPCRMDLHRGG